jgi:Flp pilus assembly CpaF family ATPase
MKTRLVALMRCHGSEDVATRLARAYGATDAYAVIVGDEGRTAEKCLAMADILASSEMRGWLDVGALGYGRIEVNRVIGFEQIVHALSAAANIVVWDNATEQEMRAAGRVIIVAEATVDSLAAIEAELERSIDAGHSVERIAIVLSGDDAEMVAQSLAAARGIAVFPVTDEGLKRCASLPVHHRVVSPLAVIPAPHEATEQHACAPEDATYGELKRRTLKRLLSEVDLKKIWSAHGHAPLEEVKEHARDAVKRVVAKIEERALEGRDRARFIQEVLDEAVGLGPLEQLMSDPAVSEIMVNGCDHIFVERGGVIERSSLRFTSNEHLLGVIERIVAPLGRRIDERSPLVDARLSDGSRVNAIIPPLALDGPALTVRRFSMRYNSMDELVHAGALSRGMADFLSACVRGRVSILVAGGTGSGKTTLLNALSLFIDERERIVTIEDSAELALQQPHVVRLESRPANIEGEGAVTIRDLVRNSLRMRPDRIVVGECRGGETLDMLQAMNTGHDGSLTTVHANNARDALMRLETMVLFAGVDLPVKAIREQVVSAVDLIVQLERFPDGARRIVEMYEVVGLEGDRITMQEIARHSEEGFCATGFVPHFCHRCAQRGVAIPEVD